MSRLSFSFAIALVAIAAALASCGGGSDRSDESPQQVVDEATLEGVDSGNLDLTVAVDATGKEGGNLDFTLSGPFGGEATGELPQLDLSATAKGHFDGDDIDFDGGVVLLPSTAFVDYEGVEYEVDPSTFSFLESVLQPEGEEGGGGSGAAACQEAAGKLQVGEFLENGRNEGSTEVGGTSTTKVSGDLDVPAALDALLEVAETPACKGQLSTAGPLPSKSEIEDAKGELRQGVKTAHVEVYVGDDDIVRRIVAQTRIEPKEGRKGPSKMEIDVDMKLTGVNEEQEIVAPKGAKPLGALFVKLGINPLELLELLQSGEGAAGLGNLLQGQGGGEDLGKLLEQLGDVGNLGGGE